MPSGIIRDQLLGIKSMIFLMFDNNWLDRVRKSNKQESLFTVNKKCKF